VGDPRSLNDWGLTTPEAFRDQAFARTVGVLTRDELARLGNSRVAIPGMGGGGGVHLIALVRAGVGKFHIADMDRYEPVNINRQHGARVDTLGQPKVDVMRRDALAINPHLEIKTFPRGIGPDNLDEFLAGVDVVVDGLDFFVWKTRRALFNRARALGIPVVTAGPIGFGVIGLVFTPDGMSFDDYFDIHDDTPDLEAILKFYVGIVPAMLHRTYAMPRHIRLEDRAGPSISGGLMLLAGVGCTEALRVLLKRPGLRPAPAYWQFDVYRQRFAGGRLRWGNRGLLQRAKIWLLGRELRRRGERFRPRPAPPDWDGAGLLPDGVKNFLVAAGVQAPSGDNTQPWRFEWRGADLRVAVEPNRDLSFFNFRQRASLISLGSVVENIRAVASRYRLEVNAVPNADPLSMTLRIAPGPAPLDPLAEAVWERDTNRCPFNQEPLSDNARNALTRAVADFSGARLHARTDPAGVRAMAEAAYWADRARVELRSAHEHFHRMTRVDAASARATGDGFSFRNLGANAAQALFLRATRPWTVNVLANRSRLNDMVALHARALIRSAPFVGLVTMPGDGDADFREGGRAVARVWLTAAYLGLDFQPVASVNLLLARLRSEGPGAFPSRAVAHLRRAEEFFRAAFPEVEDNNGLILLFRVGHAPPIAEGTFRRELSTFMVK
jgi:molybdopterin/thiamine biosynthesis adenylyltransferase